MNEYAKELGKVLESFDPDRFKGFIEKHKDMFKPFALAILEGKDDDWILGTMAKMVMNRTDMSGKDKARAREILDRKGWDYRI